MSDAAPAASWLQKLLRTLNVRRWSLAAFLRSTVILLPLCITLPSVLGLAEFELIDRMEQRIYDRRLRWFDSTDQPDERIVIIDVDEASLKQHGRWPWRRGVLARLSTELLQRQQVALLGFDMLFSEPEDDAYADLQQLLQNTPNPQSVDHEWLQRLNALTRNDAQLIDSLRGQPVVLGYYFSSNRDSGRTGSLPISLNVKQEQSAGIAGLPLMEGYTANMPALATAAPAGGFMNALTDSDGALRSVPLLAQLNVQGEGSRYYPSLSLAMFLTLLGQTDVQLEPVGGGAVSSAQNPLHLGGLSLRQGKDVLYLHTDIHGSVLVPFRSKGGQEDGRFRYVSAADVLSGKLQAGQLQGKVALLGTSAPGLRDLRVTPVNPSYPGVEVHASLLSAMLDGRFIYVPDYARGYALVSVLLVSAVLLMMLPRMGAAGAWFLCVGLMLAMTGINAWAYVQAHVALPLAASLVTVMLAYVLHVSYGLFLETRTKRQLASLFGHYVPAALVSEMVKRPEAYTTAVQSRELSIMFCDIQQFTRLAENMAPQQVQAMLNRLFNRIAAIIASNQGTIDKYIGDCVMAFWGAPLPVANHAWLAVKTATDISAMLVEFNAEQIQLGQPPIRLNIGINSGVVSVGDMGSSIRRSYTVLGDAVNVAARLEPLAKRYDVPLVAGERTVELAPQAHWQWLDHVRVAGREHPVQVYGLLDVQQPAGVLNTAQQQELALWQRFRDAYQSHAWQDGLQILQQLQAQRFDKRLYALYQARLQNFLTNPPPPNWDGVTDTAK